MDLREELCWISPGVLVEVEVGDREEKEGGRERGWVVVVLAAYFKRNRFPY